jgi:outer membrane protein TolC
VRARALTVRIVAIVATLACGCHGRGVAEDSSRPLSPERFLAVAPAAEAAPLADRETPPVAEYPIDLPTALRLAGADALEIAMARERLVEAEARLDRANLLWIPTLSIGGRYDKHEGRLQETRGDILQVSRNSGFVGAGVATSVHVADAWFEPLAARQDVSARRHALASEINDTLHAVARAYVDLLEAQVRLGVVRQSVEEASERVQLAESFARSGQGLESDAARARNELLARRREEAEAVEVIATRSARLSTLLRLDPATRLRAADEQIVPTPLLDEETPVSERIRQALANRPEVRESDAAVLAQEERLRQERVRPFVPSVHLAGEAGGFGGGPGSEFERFSERGDLALLLVWQLESLGLGNRALTREREAQLRHARLESSRVRDRVAEEVAGAHDRVIERGRQVDLARENVAEAVRSLDLNLRRIRGAEGLPIEVLQAIQAAAAARQAYVQAIAGYNRAHVDLLRAVGR